MVKDNKIIKHMMTETLQQSLIGCNNSGLIYIWW